MSDRGINEPDGKRLGVFEKQFTLPEHPSKAILQGPHLYPGEPLYQSPRPSLKNKADWEPIDLESIPDAYLAPTSFVRIQPTRTARTPESQAPRTESAHDASSYYRVAWRRMAANKGERTLMAAIIPPKVAHVDTVFSMALPAGDAIDLLLMTASMSSLLSDAIVRVAPKSDLRSSSVGRLPTVPRNSLFAAAIALRAMRLNCLTSHYDELWRCAATARSEMPISTRGELWAGGIDYPGRPTLSSIQDTWTTDSPLRRASDRRQALIEIDALLALTWGIQADDLCTVYRTVFPVLRKYDKGKYLYDSVGRLVPPDIHRASGRGTRDVSQENLSAAHEGSGVFYKFAPPFTALDREAELLEAYHAFAAEVTTQNAGSPKRSPVARDLHDS